MWRLAGTLKNIESLKKKLTSQFVLLGGGLVLILVFAIGIFLSRALDEKIRVVLAEELKRLRQNDGIAVSVGATEVGFGNIVLSDVSVGDAAWLVVNRIDVSISLNPFSDFLRPDSVGVGSVVVKVPWHQDKWPRELKIITNKILSRISQDKKNPSIKKRSFRFIPKHLRIRAARLEWAEDQVTKVLIENLGVSANILERHAAVRAEGVSALGKIKDTFIESEVFLPNSEAVKFAVRKRNDFRGKPLWSFSCDADRVSMSARCDVDAESLPAALLSPFQAKLGTVFKPGFHGSAGISFVSGSDRNQFDATLKGVFDQITVLYPTVALSPVGPISLRVNTVAQVNIAEKRIHLPRSQFIFTRSDTESAGRGVVVDSEFDFAFYKTESGAWKPNGEFRIDMDSVNCSDALGVIPKNFIPELSGFQLDGTAAFHGLVKLSNGATSFSMPSSRFDCVTTKVPEMYSGAYLKSPFIIERDTPNGKVHIPVDPGRPYYVAYADIPELVRSAFVSSEDTGFFRHHGVEVGAIIGAAERNAEANRAAIGGSTITMQTVKNLFLARDKTLSRKLQEVFLAWHLEHTISKERILEIYLNMVEFGPELYGIGRASQKFFGKHPRELSLKESIYLASLLPAPIPRFRYFCKGELTPNYARIVRQLLDRMLTLGRITSAQHAAAATEKLEFSRLERESESACARIANHTGGSSSEMGAGDGDAVDSEAISNETRNSDPRNDDPSNNDPDEVQSLNEVGAATSP